MMPRCYRPLHGKIPHESGSALILVMWTLVILTALAVAVGSHVSAGIATARSEKTDLVCDSVARAATEAAVVASVADTNGWDADDEMWSSDPRRYRDVMMEGCAYSVYNTCRGLDGGVTTNWGVRGEESRVSLNPPNRQLVEALMVVAGGADAQTASSVAAAICDWWDADDVPLTGGAENGYYATLSEPYPCRNGCYQSVYELLLVRGISRDLFDRVAPYLTVYGMGKVNINTASPVVLRSLALATGGVMRPAAVDSLVSKVMSFREGGLAFHTQTPSEMLVQLNGSAGLTRDEADLFGSMLGQVTVRSSCFGGTAVARVSAMGVEGKRIDFVFDRDTMKKVYWHER